VLCDPDARHPLDWDDGNLKNAVTGRIFPVRNGIPLFVSTVSGANLRSMRFYNRIAPFYGMIQSFKSWKSGGANFRHDAVEELDAQPGMRVLEVAAGTGAAMSYLPEGAEIFGLDISFNMLKVCQKHMHASKRIAHLFQGESWRLPFRVEVFDRVLHVGGINRFSHPARALREMVWVAKPGAKIVIVDRIESKERGLSEDEIQNLETRLETNVPGQRMLSLLPAEITDVRVRVLGEGLWYCITLRKPENPPASEPQTLL
jgi:ubiquinone/menaquinone biosynthesis C-methylase UbiE